MMIDLSRAMHDAARSGPAGRPAMAAGPVLSRIRRRRAARASVRSAVGVAAAGAVAVGGVQLVGRGEHTPAEPAVTAVTAVTENPVTSEYWATTQIECGVPAPTPTDASVYGVTLEASFAEDTLMATVGGDGEYFLTSLDGTFTVTNTSQLRFAPYAPRTAAVVIAKDGIVAMVGGASQVERSQRSIDLAPGGTRDFTWGYAPVTCELTADLRPVPVEPGGYEAYAVWRFVDETNGERIELVSRPVPLTVGPGVGDELADAPVGVRAEAVLGQILAASPVGYFPACGGPVSEPQAMPLGLSLDLATGPYAGGQTMAAVTAVSLTGDPVIANTSVPGLVITKDGIVVGHHFVGSGSPVDPTDLAPGRTLPGTATGPLSLCATSDGEVLPLPAGTYQVYALVQAFVYESRPAGDRPADVTAAYALISNPVDVTVD